MHQGPRQCTRLCFSSVFLLGFPTRSDSMIKLLEHRNWMQANERASLKGVKRLELLHGGILYPKQSMLGGCGKHPSSNFVGFECISRANHWRLTGLSASRAWRMASWRLDWVLFTLRALHLLIFGVDMGVVYLRLRMLGGWDYAIVCNEGNNSRSSHAMSCLAWHCIVAYVWMYVFAMCL